MRPLSDKTKLARLERLQTGGLPSSWATAMAMEHMPGLNWEGKLPPRIPRGPLIRRKRPKASS